MLKAALLSTLLLAPLVASCQSGPHGHGHGHAHGAVASAVLHAKSGSQVAGHARFVEMNGGVLVTIDVTGAPAGWHAVHVHQKADCSSADGKSAGGHFNPGGMQHGSPHAAMHHAGDLGNMLVNADGIGHHAIFMPELSVAAGADSVVGRGIIMHAGADDLTSQPTGAAGGRIACGEIQAGS